MPIHVVTPQERWIKLIGIPLFMLAQWLGNQYYKEPFTWELVKKNGLTLILVLLQWEFIRLSIHYFRRSFPGRKQTLIRLLLTIVVAGLTGMVLFTVIFEAASLYVGKTQPTIMLFAANFGPMFFFSALVVGAYEVVHNFFELRSIEQEKEALQKAHLQSQLDSLKSQVNPHFLFNSLNTLLSLISISPQQAEQFVEELSSVYRYLLQTNEKELTTLRQELAFTHSYFHLLKTRYGDGIQLKLNIQDAFMDYQLPSLTLQLLLENAVKHNVISPKRPLTVEIFTTDDMACLIVRNNLQRKIQPVTSHQLGLTNIVSKFQLLNQAGLTISDAEGYFTVTLPLMKITSR